MSPLIILAIVGVAAFIIVLVVLALRPPQESDDVAMRLEEFATRSTPASLEELENIIADRKNEIAAIVMEPIRDADPGPGFIEGIRSLANDIGAVFIVDEISAGFRSMAEH